MSGQWRSDGDRQDRRTSRYSPGTACRQAPPGDVSVGRMKWKPLCIVVETHRVPHFMHGGPEEHDRRIETLAAQGAPLRFVSPETHAARS